MMRVIEALRSSVTQEEFGAMVGVSQQAISGMVSDGLLPRDGSAGELLHAYCRRLREVAAGRASAAVGGLDLVQERAALARAQRDGIEMRNAVTRQEYAPVTLLGEVLAVASQAVSERFEHLPGMLKRACPDLPEAARNQIMTTIASARTEWIKNTGRLVSQHLVAEEARRAARAANAREEDDEG